MPQPMLERLRLGIANLLTGGLLLQLRSAVSSYQPLPTSSVPQDALKQGHLRKTGLVLVLVLLLLLISGVSSQLIRRTSNSAGKYNL